MDDDDDLELEKVEFELECEVDDDRVRLDCFLFFFVSLIDETFDLLFSTFDVDFSARFFVAVCFERGGEGVSDFRFFLTTNCSLT